VDQAGVIAGMSGSPVYSGGKLVGAVSYALGSFPKEPIAGITPIGMVMRVAAIVTLSVIVGSGMAAADTMGKK
jgi:cytochrome b